MYNERKDMFTIKDVFLQVLFVVLFVFLLIWLFPTKSFVTEKVDNLADSIGNINGNYLTTFNENIKSMKEAAQSYFTTARLPQKVGEIKTLTLQKMLDEKLILPFVDGKGEQCNAQKSYVEITKMDDEYILKVYLSCEDNTDYVLVHMGCYDYCDTYLCEKKEVPKPTTTKPTTPKPTTPKPTTPIVNKKYKYEYVLITNGKWGDYSNWTNWSKNKVTTNDYTQVETKVVNELVGYKDVYTQTSTRTVTNTSYDYKNKETTYTTVNGTPITQQVVQRSNAYPVVTTKNDNPIKTTERVYGNPLTETSISYTPPTTSVLTSTSTVKYKVVSSKEIMDCSSTCKKVTQYQYKVTKTTYKCPVSYNSSGSGSSMKCYKDVQTYKCPVGYNSSGSGSSMKCTKKVTTYKCPVGFDSSGSGSSMKCTNTTTQYSCPVGYNSSGSGSSTKCTKTVTNYSCPSGYSESGNICYKPVYTTSTEPVYGYVKQPVYSNVTYYRSRTRKFINGTKTVKWSNSDNDQTLLKAGYSLTGNKEEI